MCDCDKKITFTKKELRAFIKLFLHGQRTGWSEENMLETFIKLKMEDDE